MCTIKACLSRPTIVFCTCNNVIDRREDEEEREKEEEEKEKKE